MQWYAVVPVVFAAGMLIGAFLMHVIDS